MIERCDPARPPWKVIAHRGRSGRQPENAIAALDHLADSVDGVEIDVRLSADRGAVLMHDATVDRTTTASGRVAELSTAAVRELVSTSGARVPTLVEYLAACAGRPLDPILVDVKAPERACLVEVVATVRASPVADRCIVMVRSSAHLRRARELSSDLRLGAFGTTRANVHARVAAARRHGAELLLVAHGDDAYLRNRSVVPAVQAAGLRAGASTINTSAALQAAREDGCELVVTDVADRLKPGGLP